MQENKGRHSENIGRPPESGDRETDPYHTFHGIPANGSCKLLNYIMREPGTRPGKDVFIISDLVGWRPCLEGN